MDDRSLTRGKADVGGCSNLESISTGQHLAVHSFLPHEVSLIFIWG